MSGLNLVLVQDTIAAYIRQEFPNYTVVEDMMLDDETIIKNNNKIKPYIVLRWGGLNRRTAAANFGGVRFDEYFSSVDIVGVAPTGNQARRILNIVNDVLIGWKPTGGGAMTPAGGAGVYVVNDVNGKPAVFMASGRLTFAVNSEDPGAYITP